MARPSFSQEDDLEKAGELNQQSIKLSKQGKYAEAAQIGKRMLKLLGKEHLGTATSLNDLAGLYESMGNYQEAEPLYERSLEIYEKVLGPVHPDTAASLSNLAELYYKMGDYTKAGKEVDKSIESAKEKFEEVTK